MNRANFFDARPPGPPGRSACKRSRSHPHLRAALKEGVPRENVTILTKTEATTSIQMREDHDRFRRELGTDYIDIVLLHCLTDTDWPQQRKGAMEVLGEAREKGASARTA